MIRLGFIKGTSHPDNGFMWANLGTVIFKGRCEIAQGCSIRNNAQLVIGNGVRVNSNTKIVCYHYINLGDEVRISWDCFLMDTNFHCLKELQSGKKKKPFAPIKIGPRCWIAQRCVILNGVSLSENTIVSTGSILTKRDSFEPYSIVCGNFLWSIKNNVSKEQEKKPEVKIGGEGDKDFLEIEVINKDGNTIKERVKYESKESKEFTKKREEISHNEYTKAKEFLATHKNEE